MDVTQNVLWVLSSYNKALVPFCELLNCKDLSSREYEIKDILSAYLLDQYCEWPRIPGEDEHSVTTAALELVAGDDDIKLMGHMFAYAWYLKSYSSYGDAPWRRVARVIEQFAEEQQQLEAEFDFWSTHGPKI